VVFAIASGKADGHWVSGYYPGWDQDMVPPGKLPLAAITHLLHFSASICSDGSLDLTEHRLTDSHINATVQAVHASGKMVEIVLGGANSGSGFHSATLDANRARFISNIITLVTKHGYDGVDLDWEPLSKDDNQQYQTFVEELRAALKKQRAGLLLTAATAPDPFGNPEIGTLFARLQDKYDQINLMTYVLSGAWPGWISWHGSPLHNGGLKFSSGRSLPSIEECVAEFISAGVAPGKLGIGLAFHGDVWSGGTGTPTGGVTAPLQEWKTPPKVRSDVYFSEIMRRFYSADHERRDERAETPYLSIDNPGSAQDTFVSYCDPAAITARLKFLREKGVGGCIIWHLGQDLLPSGDQPLARAVEEFLNRKSEQ
jgi:chitinase